MGFKTILVPTEQHDLMHSTLETALLLARKFDSYIEGFALHVTTPAAAFATSDAGGVFILEQEIAENAKQTRTLFETFMQQHGVPCGILGRNSRQSQSCRGVLPASTRSSLGSIHHLGSVMCQARTRA